MKSSWMPKFDWLNREKIHIHTYTLRKYADELSLPDGNGNGEFMNAKFDWLNQEKYICIHIY